MKKALIESLETRQLLTANSSYAQLIGQDDASIAHSNITGAGIGVAVIDTGIDYTQTALGGGFGSGYKVVAGYDFFDNDSNPIDTDGHGTAVAATIAADEYTYNGVTYSGIAPDAHLVALRIGTEDNLPISNIGSALDWVVANHDTYNIKVINLSLGTTNTTQTANLLSSKFAAVAALGIFITAASGNSGATASLAQTISYPAADANVFAVGSVNASSIVSTFTQRGSDLDLLAPGEAIVVPSISGGYTSVDGTSFASPMVAGTAALLYQVNPNLTGAQIASLLESSSQTTFDGDDETGNSSDRDYGRLNVLYAMDLTLTWSEASEINTSKNTVIDSAIDSWGVIHVAYYDAEQTNLMYTTISPDGTYATPIIVDGSGTDVGGSLSIAIDQTGKPSIAYYDATKQDLKYAAFNGAEWITRRVDRPKSVGQYASLAFNSENEPLIAYYAKSGGNLKLATYYRESDSFARSTLDSTGDVGQYASLATRSDSQVGDLYAVAYYDRTNGNVKYYRYASNLTTPVLNNIVDDLTGAANITLSLSTGQAQIAYQDTANGDVKYAYYNSTWFSETVISSGSVGLSLDMTYTATNTPVIAYYNRTKDALYVAERTGTDTWSNTRITTGGYNLSVETSLTGDIVAVTLDRPGTDLVLRELLSE